MIIDEVSMLRADLLDAIDYRLRSARGNFRQSFGGVQLLLIGDLYQLPPVVKREEERRLTQYYKSPWFFESHALQRDGFVYIELDKIFRQADQEFIGVLNNLRVNTATPEDLSLLNKYYHPPEEIGNMRDVITLTTHNNKADEMNARALRELASPSHFFNAKIDNDFPESMYPVLPSIELKEGAQIMFTRNDAEGNAYYNGKLATVTSISGTEITVQMAGSGNFYTLRKSVWENKKYKVNDETKELEDEVVGVFEQYPIKLAWAITVHKSQGLTFDKAIIDVGQAFADGQVYVALSRLRSIDGLILRTKVEPGVVSTDKQIVSFDQQHNRPETLSTEIKSRQKDFLSLQLGRTFDFELLVKEISYLSKDDGAVGGFDEETMKPVLNQLKSSLSAESDNLWRFRAQLHSLLESGKHDDLLVRIRKGADYYKTLLWDQVKLLAQHIEDMRGEKRVKGYLSDLGDLDQLISKKLEEVDKIYHLAEGILGGREHFDFEMIKRARSEARAAMLHSIVRTEKPAAKKGKKKKKGDPSTYDISIAMAEQGMSVDEIAKERELVRGTIEGHLAKGVEDRRIDILKFMSEADVDRISTALREMPEGFISSELYSKLKGAYSYGQLRAVMGHTGIKSKRKQDIIAGDEPVS
ncbi:MAG TPA: helix-turn-helix domain-containing protein [Cyclobacteriaceae bacterium]|nr:helix-turn-helix domain-containing protein [Cyclobacteriaceae bacterium]